MRAPISNGGAAFSLPGFFYNGTPYYRSNGYYWSSTMVGSITIAELGISRSSITLTGASQRTYGYSVRCILNQS